MSDTTEVVSAAAAVIGLVVGALSTLAAFRAADSARSAQRAADEAAHRVDLFTISRTASDVLVELQRIVVRSQDAKGAYQTLAVFSGSYQNSGIEQAKSNVETQSRRAHELAEQARLFIDGDSKLRGAPPEEIDRVQLRLAANLSEIVAIREELERTLASAEATNAQYRAKAISR